MQDLANRLKVEQQRLAISGRSTKAQINAQQSRLQQLGALAKLKKDQVDALKVRSGTNGVLQVVAVQEGQQVAPGVNIARVADPASLKAELKIAETQIKDVRVGQPVAVDTRNGIIQGRVSRIDPAAREGTFVVDAELTGPLPGSARPDLSVDGTIELERLVNVLYVGRPAFGQTQQTVGMFRLSPDGQEATRVQVALGRTSVSTVEVVSGLTSVCRSLYQEHSFFRIIDKLEVCRTKTKETVMSATDPLIHLADVRKVFYTDEVETHALSGIHLDIKKGEYLSIAGPSGCGKSTLLSILGLLDTPSDGEYVLNDKPVENLSLSERARIRNREVGFIFQSFNLIGDLTVYENVELPLTYRGMNSSDRKERVTAALERVGMAHRAKHLPSQLSGGQQQRVAVARAVGGQPSILLADEPTGNLDSTNGEAVMELLRELHRGGATICMVTHDPRYAQHADRIVHLFDGLIVEEEAGANRREIEDAKRELKESGFGDIA